MNDVAPARSANRQRIISELLFWIAQLERAYGADWIVAYDLQHAKKLIEREQRSLAGEQVGAERAEENTKDVAARSASPR